MIQDRIKQFIEYKGVTPYKFCKDLKFSMGYLDKKGAIGTDKYLKIIEYYPEINSAWLLTGKGEMLKIQESIAGAHNKVMEGAGLRKTIEIMDKLQPSIPLLPFDAFGGVGDDGVEGVDINSIQDSYVIPLFQGIKIDFMIPVRGSSMYPKYNSGDVVACRLINELMFIQWNKVYVIDTISQGTIIKRLKKAVDIANVICKSDNKDYDEFELPKSDIRTIAMVVGVIRIE